MWARSNGVQSLCAADYCNDAVDVIDVEMWRRIIKTWINVEPSSNATAAV